jgi:pimeloyl-ACP methyl ester carboxylesterase
MHYQCEGRGRPTVVLDAGSPDPGTVWRWVEPAIARVTRVCTYDRAGIGQSAPAPRGQHRTPRTQVRDLHELLRRAGIAPRYIVVGHSWGGLLARLFAYEHPKETVGAVLVDATTFPYLTPATAKHLRRKRNAEGIDIPAAVAQSAAIKSLGHLPLIVLGHGRPPLDGRFLDAQDAEAALSDDSIDAIARNSTHYIQKPAPTGQPGVVVAAVRAVVNAARQGSRLPACGSVFAGAAVDCRP